MSPAKRRRAVVDAQRLELRRVARRCGAAPWRAPPSGRRAARSSLPSGTCLPADPPVPADRERRAARRRHDPAEAPAAPRHEADADLRGERSSVAVTCRLRMQRREERAARRSGLRRAPVQRRPGPTAVTIPRRRTQARVASPQDDRRARAELRPGLASQSPLPASCSSSFALLVKAEKPACSQSFTPAAASDHVSTRPKRGARICVAPRPAADPGADAARARDELADRLAEVAGLDRLTRHPRAGCPRRTAPG